MLKTRINILGTEYELIIRANNRDYPFLEDNNGVTDTTTKTIVVNTVELGAGTKQCMTDYENEIIRHELVHAFFYESGLDIECQNEHLVDWIAIQFIKMFDVFKPLGVMAHEQLTNNSSVRWIDPNTVRCQNEGKMSGGYVVPTMSGINFGCKDGE